MRTAQEIKDFHLPDPQMEWGAAMEKMLMFSMALCLRDIAERLARIDERLAQENSAARHYWRPEGHEN